MQDSQSEQAAFPERSEGSRSPGEEAHVSIDNEARPGKRERRSKDDKYQRNYICGCSKSYLSYAALYTHAKTKHDGVFPEGTTTLHKKKQGRPKKDDFHSPKVSGDYEKIFLFNSEFISFLEKIPGAKNEKEPNQKFIIEAFSCDFFSRQEHYERILVNLEQIRKELVETYGPQFLSKMDIIMFEISNIKKLNCNEVFALFLVCSFRFVTVEFYREIVFFVVCFRLMMNEVGWEKYRDLNDGAEKPPDSEFCEEQNAEYLPDFCNDFLLDYLPVCFGTNKILCDAECLVFFGTEAVRLLRMILLIKHFCMWLFTHRFTKAKIEILKD